MNNLKLVLPILLLSFFSHAKAAPLLDIMVVMDSSGSISSADYTSQIDQVSDFIDGFTFGVGDTRMGLVEFSSNAYLRSGLSDDKAALTNALQSGGQLFGQTNWADSLLMAANELVNNGRVNAGQFIVLLSDGVTNISSGSNPLIEAISAAITAKNQNIAIYGVGIGSQVSDNDFFDIVSAPFPEFSYMVDDYEQLSPALSAISQEIQGVVTVDEPGVGLLMLSGLFILLLTRQYKNRATQLIFRSRVRSRYLLA